MKKVFKAGDIVDVYLDPQTRKEFMGKGKLIEYVRTSDPFIIERNEITEKLNLNYVLEYWRMNLNGVEVIRGIRRIENIGITSSNFLEEHIFNNTPATTLVDRFVSLPDYDTSEWDSRVDETEISGEMY